MWRVRRATGGVKSCIAGFGHSVLSGPTLFREYTGEKPNMPDRILALCGRTTRQRSSAELPKCREDMITSFFPIGTLAGARLIQALPEFIIEFRNSADHHVKNGSKCWPTSAESACVFFVRTLSRGRFCRNRILGCRTSPDTSCSNSSTLITLVCHQKITSPHGI